MSFDLNALFEKEAFASLGEERLALFRQFARDIEGKSAVEIVALYVALNRQAIVSEAERAAILEALQESLPESSKQKFGQIFKMLR
jgi:hypothetical protein